MTLQMQEKNTNRFYWEVIQISSQSNALRKRPNKKLTDFFAFFVGFAVLLLVLLCYCLIRWVNSGFYSMLLPPVLICLLGLMYAFLCITKTLKRYRELKNTPPCPSTLTLDERGATADMESGTAVRISWDVMAFIRVFEELICFMPNKAGNAMIFVERERAQEILDWLRENKPDVLVIQ